VFVIEHNSNHKGNVAELAIATEAANLGLSVLKPLTEHEIYDLALDLGDRIWRIQCKWATFNGDVVHVHVGRSRTSRRGYVRTTYEKGDIDAPARNNQRAAINFAKDYELGAVAQGKSDALAARRAWVRIPPAPLSKPDLKFPMPTTLRILSGASVWMSSIQSSRSTFVWLSPANGFK
jgi:PD-(D/E)XK endonuclease